MKTIMISGASGALGVAVTRHFLEKEYQVLAAVSSEGHLDFLSHDRLDVKVVDLSNEAAAEQWVRSSIDRYKTIDAAVLLVGGFTAGAVQQTTVADIQQQLSVNFFTAYNVAKPLLEHMKLNSKGRLVFIGARPASKASFGKGLVAYSLSKSLLYRLAELINEDAKGTGVTASVVAPSTIDTAANRKAMPQADPENWVKPEQLADMLELLVSEKGGPLRETVLNVYGNA